MAENGLIGGLVISIMINVFVIAFVFATGIGQDCWRRWRNKQRFRKGGFVNSLMVTKDGVIKEIFKPVTQGKFKFKDSSYIRVPALRLNFRGIPSFIHKEDSPEPVDVFDKDPNGLLSCAEMDDVMNGQSNFDLKLWLQQAMPFILFGALIVIGAFAAMAYFNYSSWEMLRDGTFKAVKIAASPIVNGTIG